MIAQKIWRVFAILLVSASSAAAEGFAITDLTQAPDSLPVLGTSYIRRVEADRITYGCLECEGRPMIDVLMGKTTDGTEGRIRSGQTTMAKMQALCQTRDPNCTIKALKVEPAVGYISSYQLGNNAGNTVVVMRDGDMLTIRSISSNPKTARENARLLELNLIPAIVGK
jgi:hypothetical protein